MFSYRRRGFSSFSSRRTNGDLSDGLAAFRRGPLFSQVMGLLSKGSEPIQRDFGLTAVYLRLRQIPNPISLGPWTMRPSPDPGEQLRRLADEVTRQPEALEEFANVKLPRAPKGSIFVGAGDSYAVAVAAICMSKSAYLAMDPYSLIAFPKTAVGREVYFVSASGRTTSNIGAAKRVLRFAKRTTALTADDKSRLAVMTARIVKLPMKVVPRTPGLLSFSLSLLAALKISVGGFSCDFKRAFDRAKADSEKVSFGRGTTYFLGNSATYAVALYSAAKMHEFLGMKAHAELLEEFSHTELFSLTESDSVNVFSCLDVSGIGAKLCGALIEKGYESQLIPTRGSSDIERLFHSVFVGQLAVLREAEADGLSGPRFLSAKDRLGISDDMIY